MTPCTPVVSSRFTRCQEASSAAAATQATSWMMSCRHQPQLPNIQRCCVAMLHACPARRTKHLPTRPPEQAKRILARYVSILQGMNACKPIKARILNLHSPHLLKRKMGLHESHGCCNNTGKQIHMGSIRHIFQLHQLFVSLSFLSSGERSCHGRFCGFTADVAWPMPHEAGLATTRRLHPKLPRLLSILWSLPLFVLSFLHMTCHHQNIVWPKILGR